MKKRILLTAGILLSGMLIFGCDAGKDKVTYTDIEKISFIDGDEEGSIEHERLMNMQPDEVDNGNDDINSVEDTSALTECPLEDGIYIAEFDTDSSMFHVNEMCDGKGELTVKDGVMTIHVSLTSKKIVNLYYGLAEDAQAEGAVLLEPSIDMIDYDDGTTDEVNGFDIPVPYLDEEFDVALVGTKGTWYDHKVSVSNPVLKDGSDPQTSNETDNEENALKKGDYTIEVDLEGGSGKATITSPCSVKTVDGKQIAIIEWSSPNYDYMIVGDEKYLPVNEDGNSVFEIPVDSFDEPLEVIADTVAMSKPHEIEYTLVFHSDTMKVSE